MQPVDGVIVAEVLGLRPHPDGRHASNWSTSTPATARRCRSAAARSTWPPATSCRWPRSAPSCPTAWRSAGASCGASGRTACSARPRELGLGDDHGGILILPRRISPLGAPRVRGPRRHAPTSCSTSTSPATGPTPGATAASPATWPPTSACPSPTRARPSSRPGPSVSAPVDDRRARALRPVHVHRRSRACAVRAVGARGWPSASSRAGMRPDQQRGRRLELRDARARPAQPPLRPRPAARRRAFRVRRARAGRDDGDARRRRAHARRPTTC